MLGPFLIAARRRRHVSQQDLALKAGIAPSYLSQIECHNRIPSREVLQELARALGLPTDLLIRMLYPAEEVPRAEVLVCPNTC